jgi:hypothetical protein
VQTWALRFALVMLVFGPDLAAAQRNAVKATIRGRVLDQNTARPIPDVHVEFVDGRTIVRATAVSDDEGSFVLSDIPRGSFRLRASRIGYAHTITPYWRVESGEVLTVAVHLHPDAVPLAPLEITARAQSQSPVLSSYYRRLERRVNGSFITREEIEKSNAGAVTDLLRTVPGIQIETGLGQHSRSVSMVRSIAVTSFANGCPVQVYLDGVLASRNDTEPVPLDELATPAVLEGIEIFRGISSVPPEFLTPEARCGVIALWTRRGG